MDWSYELLTEDERSLFSEISVFSGGFYMEDVEAICSAPDAFFLLITLRDKSLVKTVEIDGENRFSMLETLRMFAAEKLSEGGDPDELHKKHSNHYLEHTRIWNDAMHSSGEAMQKMALDIDNIRSGMDYASSSAENATVIAYGILMARFLRREVCMTKA